MPLDSAIDACVASKPEMVMALKNGATVEQAINQAVRSYVQNSEPKLLEGKEFVHG